MKLQFKTQDYQTDAVNAVVDVFAGQLKDAGVTYRIDPGRAKDGQTTIELGPGLRNAPIALSASQLLANIRAIQAGKGLNQSTELATSKAAPGAPNLTVEMETGTGKTYVYIKTMMEMHRRYGWSKFIVVVPSIAIREGVKKTFDVTAEHFMEEYKTKPRAFIYNSAQLHELERFSSDAGVQVMIINIQAFNATGKDQRRIYDELDDFQSRRPIDVISANRPIVIIDEPQRFGEEFDNKGKPKKASASLEALAKFDPLMVLRYSATHKPFHEYNKVYRLDAVDAYNAKLVKKIGVRGLTVRGLAGSTAYIYLDAIEVKKGAPPTARIEMEVQTGTGIRRLVKRVTKGSRLHDLANGVEAYKDLVVTDVDAVRDIIELSTGDVLHAGEATLDVTEEQKRRIQIREVIRSHIEKERTLHPQGIKVLSLFFIDEVAKYRDYDREDTLGDYARIFEEEYELIRAEVLAELEMDDAFAIYQEYLRRDAARDVHGGYFSIDKKTGRQIDPRIAARGDEKGQATEAGDYDLILKDKEKLLDLATPLRFLFSHSALREGWDNPNVFVMGMLKKSDNSVSRRQEVGRGLRIAVNQHGERMDHPATVHEINELTVVCDESYQEFVDGLQNEIAASLSARPRKATEEYFTGRTYRDGSGIEALVDEALAKQLVRYLIKNDYIGDDDTVTQAYKDAREVGELAPAPEALAPVVDFLLPLVDALYLDMPVPRNDRKPKPIPFNRENFEKKEFQALWNRINHRVVYQVDFDSSELIDNCVDALDAQLHVASLQYVVQTGSQRDALDVDALERGTGFTVSETRTHTEELSARSQVKYDLLGEITEKTHLTRRTVAKILRDVKPSTFAKFRLNPEQFITETARIINEQKATLIVNKLTYDTLEDRFDSTIFTQNQTAQDFTKAGQRLKRHVYDYVVTDSKVERDFVSALDTSTEVAVYAKLPRGFFIPTPVGDYNPDWAIAFTEGSVKHVYFVAETKGSLSSLQLKGVENAKIDCARKYFEALERDNSAAVKYGVVTSYAELMQLVSA
ncbi:MULTISPECIES: type III restriction-modification system endonuclease [Microbacterium]|uniref:type III restriction-modification system endonuclease n=1 Tax=Microbacterium TaxID=33882 RepID=UPI00217EDE8C|nr:MULTISPECIES: DEAD/DEAH box helicase family protein [Microbacterium]UWF77611.1 DEAD/DEAH box helicase family protein [Microbacterium neungamense]WCM55782.1 DEAD/DEAH box helicase family protein [Microbacterium sp. EF45047]